MREPKLIETRRVKLTEIISENRMRPVNELAVDTLEKSYNELGVLIEKIQLRKVAHRDGVLVLMDGSHRMALAHRLNWDDIKADIWDCNDDQAALFEVDSGLANAELSTLELAIFLAKKKRIYEKLHPETKGGVAGGLARQNSASDIVSFAKSVAEKRDISERQIQRLVAIGSSLSPMEVADLNKMEKPVSLAVLQDLAKIDEPIIRGDVIARLTDGKASKVNEALEQLNPKKKSAKNPKDEAYSKLFQAWKRTPKAVQRRFVDENKDDLFGLIADGEVTHASN